MQTLMPTLLKVVFNFKCYVQSALAVCYGCAHLYVLVLFGKVENYLILKLHESHKWEK